MIFVDANGAIMAYQLITGRVTVDSEWLLVLGALESGWLLDGLEL